MAEYDEFEEFHDIDIEVFFAENGDETPSTEEQATDDANQDGEDNNATGPSASEAASEAAKPKQSKRKKAIPRPASTYNLQNALDEKQQLLQALVTTVTEDEIICESSVPFAVAVKTYADTCISKLHRAGSHLQLALQHFAALLSIVWPTIAITEKHSLSSDRKCASLSAFFELRNKDALWNKANELFRALCGFDAPHLYIQIFARVLHEKVLKEHEKIPPAQKEDLNTQLDRQEQNALRYTTGYIVGRLSRKILHQKEKEQMQTVLDNMKKGSDKDTRLSYTREWVETQSRGGLVMVNDGTFLFFQVIEKLIRKNFPKTTPQLRGTDLREGILSSALQDQLILDKWTLLTAHSKLSEAGSLTLLQLLIGFYTQVRGFSFAKNINERFKIRNKKQGKGTKGVRSTLKRADQEKSTEK